MISPLLGVWASPKIAVTNNPISAGLVAVLLGFSGANSCDCKKLFEIICSQSTTNVGRVKQMGFLRLLSVFMTMCEFAVTVAAQTPGAPGGGAPQAGGGQAAPASPPMVMAITGFADGTEIPAKYTQAGNQTSPAITWTNVPAGTNELPFAHA